MLNNSTKGQVLSLKKLKGTILLLDVETTNETKTIVELSGKIVNNNLISILTFSYIIKETWDDKDLMSGIYATKDKVNEWTNNIRLGRSQVVSAKQLTTTLDNLVKKYNVKVISAYNLKFDLNAMIETFKHYNVYFNNMRNLQKLDLWLYAGEIFLKAKYVNYCVDRNYLTEKGNCITNAETVYRYISNDDTFIETHVAIDDVNIELEILRVCALYNPRPILNQMQNAINYTNKMKKFFK